MPDLEVWDSLTFTMAAAIICITCLFYSTMIRKRARVRNRLFMMLVVIILIDALMDLTISLATASSLSYGLKLFLTYSSEMIYYGTHVGIIPIFFFYIVVLCGVQHKFPKYQILIIKIPVYVLELLVLSTPFTNFVFVHKGDLVYERGTGTYVAYVLSGLYLVFLIYILIRFWFTINSLKRIAMFYFLLISTVGTLLQMFIPAIKCELLCESIGLMGIMLMIEKDDDITDTNSGAYNRTAFIQDVISFFRVGRRFETVCIRIDDINTMRKIFGYTNLDGLLMQIVSFLDSLDEGCKVYHVAFSSFYIIYTDRSSKEIQWFINRIEKRFDKEWTVGDRTNKVNATILLGSAPEQFGSLNDILLLSNTNLDGIEKKVLMGHDLDFLLRRIEVEKAIGRGINEKNFKLNYRPIYRSDDARIKLAEGELSLLDKELGEISPEEFYMVAAASGFIDEIQSRTIESVCRFLASGVDTSDMQIDYVLVPIMSYKLLNTGFVQSIKKLIERFNIDPSLLAFEFKEANAAVMQEGMERFFEEFSKMGIRLFISDYEHGFLQINTNTTLQFEGIVLDIRKLIAKESYKNVGIVLQNRTNMIKQLGKTIILSGIDTKGYYDMIKEVSADYWMGDYFSPSISKNELQNKFWHGEKLIIHEDRIERIEEDDW